MFILQIGEVAALHTAVVILALHCRRRFLIGKDVDRSRSFVRSRGVVGVVVCLRALVRSRSRGLRTFGGVFAADPALSLVKILRVRVGVIYPCIYLYVIIQKQHLHIPNTTKIKLHELYQPFTNPRVAW